MEKQSLKSNLQKGMSVIEVVLAAAIFVIFSSAAVRSLLQNYNSNRTGAEFTVASEFASEGLEAARSIKNQGFNNLVNTAGCGLTQVGNLWAFQSSCTNNTLTHNSSDNYVRTIKVESVNRGTGSSYGSQNVLAYGTYNPITLTKPAGTVEGDLLIATFYFEDSGSPSVVVSPSGWIALSSFDKASPPQYGRQYYKLAGASEPANYSWTLDLSANGQANIARFSGVDQSNPIDAEGAWAFGTSAAPSSSVTTVSNNALLYWFTGDYDLPSGALPSGFTDITNLGAMRSGYKVQPSAGGSGALTGTGQSGDRWISKTVAVRPDPDNPAGGIVASGGTTDPDTKKIISTVSWNFGPGRPESVSLITYLSNWIKPISDGLLVYGRSANTTPRLSTYEDSSNTFAANTDTVSGAAGRNFVVKTSPTKQEAIVGYVDSSTLRVICFDGANWTNEWSVAVGGSGVTRRFDVGYEYGTGDVMVLYSTNSGTNELAYRTKPGSSGCGTANWASASTFDSPGTTGVVSWIKLSADSRSGSNVLGATWADLNRDLQAAIWDGSDWTQRAAALETDLECRGTCSGVNIPNGDSFDIDFESSSGEVMVVWGSGGSGTANGAWYNKCDGTTPGCVWNGSRTAITSMLNDATSLDISANPNSDEVLFASIGDGGSDLQAARWSGSDWTGTNDLDATALTPVADSSMVATGWLTNGSTTRGIVVFANSGTQSQRIHGFVWDGGSFVRQGTDSTPWFTPTPLLGTPRWYDIQMDPKNQDRLMFIVSNSANDLFAKRLEMSSTGTFTWTNPTYTDGTAIETGLVQAITNPYYFSYWRNP